MVFASNNESIKKKNSKILLGGHPWFELLVFQTWTFKVDFMKINSSDLFFSDF